MGARCSTSDYLRNLATVYTCPYLLLHASFPGSQQPSFQFYASVCILLILVSSLNLI